MAEIVRRPRAAIVGVGAALPGKSVENKWFEAKLETSDEWIRQRTGILSRRVLSEKEPEGIRDLLIQAAEEACVSAQSNGRALGTSLPDLLVCACTTPSDLFGDAPAIVSALARKGLIAENASAFDVRAGCNGFLVGLVTAAKYLEAGMHRKAVVVGGEAFSQWVDWSDRSTCVLFGDGAGAVVMELSHVHTVGIIASLLRSRGDDCLQLPLQVSHPACSPCANSPRSSTRAPTPTSVDSLEPATIFGGESVLSSSASSMERSQCPAAAYRSLQMRGAEVFNFATQEVPCIIRAVLAEAKMSLDAVQWFVLHQANSRILQAVAGELGIPAERMLSNIRDVGNVGAASVPLLLKEAGTDGRLKAGDVVVIAAFGAGLSWGATVLRWCDFSGTSSVEVEIEKEAADPSASTTGSSTEVTGDCPRDDKVASVDEVVDRVLRQVLPEIFEEGGDLRSDADSLSSMLFAQKVAAALGGSVTVPPTLLVQCDSIVEVKDAVRALVTGTDSMARARQPAKEVEESEVRELPSGVEAEFPCTSLQRTMLLRHASDPQGHHFMESFVWTVNSAAAAPLCADKLREAWLAVVRLHPALRSSFSNLDGDTLPIQCVWSLPSLAGSWFEVIPAQPSREVAKTATEVAFRQRCSVDLTAPPLFRLAVVTSSEAATEGGAVVLTLPHAIVDGYSMGIIMSDLAAAYAASRSAGAPQQSRPSFELFARSQASMMDVQRAAAHLCAAVRGASREVAGVSGLLILEVGAPVVRARHRSAGVAQPLYKMARLLRTTPAAVVHAAWSYVWNQHLDGDCGAVLYAATTACRSAQVLDIGDIVGPVLNTVPVRVDITAGELGIAALARKCSEALLAARQFEGVPLAVAMQAAGAGQELQVIFDFQGDGRWMQVALGEAADGAAAAPSLCDARLIDRAGVPLSVRVARDGADFVLSATSETAQLPSSFIRILLHSLDCALGMLAAAASSCSDTSAFPCDLPLIVMRAGMASVVAAMSAAGCASEADEEDALMPQRALLAAARPAAPGPATAAAVPVVAVGTLLRGAPAARTTTAGLAKAPAPRFVAASTPIERALARIIAEAVALPGGGDALSVTANLRSLGFDSLRAMRALGAAKASGIQVSLRLILAAQSVRELASKAVMIGAGPDVLGSVRGEVIKSVPFDLIGPVPSGADAKPDEEPYPLFGVGAAHYVGLQVSSFAASGEGGVAPQIYWEWVFGEGDTACQVDAAKFEEALDLLVARHPTLRAKVLEDGTLAAPATPPGACKAQVVAPWTGDAAAAELALLAARAAMSGGGDTIGSPLVWPLFAFRITHTGPRSSVVHLAISLFLMDAVSDLVFRAELSKVYRSLVAGKHGLESLLPAPILSFGMYSRSLVHGLPRSPAYAAASEFWQAKIRAGLPDGPALPRLPSLAAGAESAEAGRAFTNASKWFDKEQWARVQSNCSGHGVTVPVALLTAYCLALARHQDSPVPRFLINVLLCLRYPVHPDMDRVLGNCSSTILVDVDLRPQEGHAGEGLRLGFGKAAQLVAAALSESLEHSAMSGVEVMEQVNRARGSTFSAVAPFIFTTPIGVERGTGGDAEKRDWCFREQFFSERVPHTACVNAIKDDPATGGACASLDVVVGAFPNEVTDALTGSYAELLDLMAAQDAAARWADPVELLLAPFAAVPAVAPPQPVAPRLLHEGTLASARTAAAAPAIIAFDAAESGEQRVVLSYHDLVAKANAAANRLLRAVLGKLGRDELLVVAVVMEKSWEQVVAAHAILVAGGAYVPTEPRLWPEDRVRTVFGVSGAHAVLARSRALVAEHAWLHHVGLPVISIGDQEDTSADGLDMPSPRRTDPEQPAYLIYTSGSTGKPKGVVCHHLGAVNTLEDLNDRWAVTQKDRCLALSSLAFDLSVYDIFGLLSAGGTIVIPPAGSMSPPDPELWVSIAEAEKVTLWNSVPAFVDLLCTAVELCDLKLPSALRLCWMSGDYIPLKVPSRLSAAALSRGPAAPALQVTSMGGATEAAIWSNQYAIAADGSIPSGWSSVPYGIPLRNQTMYILQEPSLLHAAPWVTGVIYIGGVGVATGYHNDADKTKFQFIAHPRTGEKLFRTGDLGRMRGGLLEICGREDAQVKLNGFRVELGEVEHILLGPLESGSDLGVQVVAAAASVQGGQLCAHVVLVSDLQDDVGQSLREGSERWGVACGELRARCAQHLPQYMVPAHFASIDKLPLSANGKLQRDKLPRVAQSFEEADGGAGGAKGVAAKVQQPVTAGERAVREVIAKMLNLPADSICCQDGDFFQLGGSSVTALRLLLALRDHRDLAAFGCGGILLSVRDLLAGATVAKLAALLASKGQARGTVATELVDRREESLRATARASPEPLARGMELLTLQPGTAGSQPPLVLFNPAGASCLCYMDLVRCLSSEGFDGPVIGVDDGCITRDDGDLVFQSIAEVVKAAVPFVLEAAAASGRVILGGWSYGGAVALEVAKALAKDGGSKIQVLGLFMFDAPLDAAVVSEPPEVEEAVRSAGQAASLHFSSATALLRHYHAGRGAAQGLRALHCGILDVRPMLAEDLSPSSLPPFDWRAAGVGSARSVVVPGTHWTMLNPREGGKVVAAEMCEWLRQLS